MQDNFLTKISHEVRTPINAIIGLGFLFQQTRLDDKQRKFLTTIISSAENLLQTFQGILDYTSTEEGTLELQNLPFNTQVFLENVAQTTSLRCQERKLKFSMTCAEDVPAVLMGDSIRISQILLNISQNAVKFTPSGYVHLHVETVAGEEDKIRFSIADTGIGIPKDWREKIFEPFMQVDNSHTRTFGGAGLGLATCKQLTTIMHGDIQVFPNSAEDAEVENPGSIFVVTLPLPKADASMLVKETSLKGKKILVVDHNTLHTQSVVPILLSLGMDVETSSHSEEALKKITEADRADVPYDFALIAWQMPEMDGIEIAQYIRDMDKRNAPPALVLMSDYCVDEVEILASETGFKDFIQTPANFYTYSETLLEICEQLENERLALEMVSDVVEDDVPIRILLVEDNEINQEIAYEVLTSAMYEVDIANNGQEAVECVQTMKYSLILMDIQMPVMDGLEATKIIRAAGYKMPIIAMTAHSMADDKETSITAGMNAHLTKPLEPMALFSTISSFLPKTTQTTKKEIVDKEINIVRKDKLPDTMEGFNLTNGLAAVAGNETLYISLLRKFATRYADINKDISECIQKNDFETAIRHAHTVRGIAANLGVEALASAAEALEKAIALAPSMTAPHLRTLVLRLTEAVETIRNTLGFGADSEESDAVKEVSQCLNPAEREHAKHVLDLAITRMEQDWGHANDIIDYLLERLHETKANAPLTQLKQALEDFDVEHAQSLSVEIQKML